MPKKKSSTREHTLQMRVNEDELKIIEEKAEKIGLTVSNYMRMVSLNANIKVTINKGQQ